MVRTFCVRGYLQKHGAVQSFLLALTVLACIALSTRPAQSLEVSSNTAAVATITVTPSSPSIAVFATQQFTATAKDAKGHVITGLTFTWASSAKSIATINSSGLATGVAAGTTQITATSGKVTSAGVKLTVTPPVVATIVVTPASPSITVNATQQFTAKAKDAKGNAITGLTFTWASSSKSVATINNSGLATGIAAGSTQITATHGSVTSSPVTLKVTAVSGTSVTGIAAMGAPIASAKVTLKDSAGHSSTATTAAAGTYTLSTAGFTPPFLIQVQAGSGNLYSVSADALTTTTINTDPFTDLIIRSWYSVQGVSIDAAFANPASHPAPAVQGVQILHNMVESFLQLWLANAGITPSKFNLISTPFTANGSGLDKVLDESTVNTSTGKVTITAGGTTQTSTITYNTTAGTMTVASTTTNSKGTSQATNSTIVPTHAAQQAALTGITTALISMVNAVNSNGSQLTAAELMPFLATDLLDESLNQTQYAAMLATGLRGSTLAAPRVIAINGLDTTNGKADVITNLTVSPMSASPFLTPEVWLDYVDGAWLIGGDQRIALVGLQIANRNHQGCPLSSCGGSGGTGVAIGPTVAAPDGLLTKVTITDASGVTGWNNTQIPSSDTEIFEFQPTPTTTLDVSLRQFDNGWTDLAGTETIPAGTAFTFTLTPTSGPVVDYVLTSNASTTESIAITSPSSDTLTSYTLGQPQAVTWTLPTTFPIAFVYLGAESYTSLPQNRGPSTYQCEIGGSTATVSSGFANSGTITIPPTCHGQPILFLELEVGVMGVNGEIESATLNID